MTSPFGDNVSPEPSGPTRRAAFVLTQDRGGPADVTVALAAALAERPGWQVRLFAPPPARNTDRVRDLLMDSRVEGKGAARDILAARRRIMNWRPDVVHAQDRRSGLVCAGLGRGPRGRHRPVVVHTYHGVPDDVTQAWLADRSAPGPSRYTRAVLAGDALVARSVDRTIVVADVLRGFLTDRLRVPAHRVVHIDNGLVLPERPPGPGRGPVRRLLFVGLLVHRKGVDLLLHALAAAEESLRLTVAGDGPERQTLERLAADLGLAARVEFLGFRSDVPTLMADHDAFVLPARMEQQPLVLIEAMAAGLPVVATDVGGVRDMLGGHGRLVTPEDHRDLAVALDELAGVTGSSRTAISRDLQHYARGRFGIQTCLEHHLELYFGLLR